MSKIAVELVDHMGSDLMVANCARVSFGKWKTELDERDNKLITYLADHEHMSPFRHPQIQLRCKAPVFLARQLQKHTVGLTWNEISRRYVDSDVEFFVPDTWRSRPDNGIKQGSGDGVVEIISQFSARGDLVDRDIRDAYYHHYDSSFALYEDMLKSGVAPEQARMVLPQSMMVSWIWTGSLQAFYHIYRLRNGEGAQEEAKEFAKLLNDVVEPLFPHSWSALKNASTTH